MEREALPEGSCGLASSPALDVSKLGDGEKKSPSHYFISDPEKDERNARQREYRRLNRDRILATERASKARNKDLAREAAYAKQWRLDNSDRFKSNSLSWREKNREKLRAGYRSHYAANKEKRLAQAKASRERDPLLKEKQAAYRAKNRERINSANRAWWKSHPEKQKQKDASYLSRKLELKRLKRANDPIERIKDASRTRVRFILEKAGVAKHDHTFDLIGCTPDFLKSFLEAQFNPMMNWDNYGTYWEIDHIIAVSKFNLEDREQLNKAFHYSNCRPLEVPSNRAKCDNGIGFHQPLLI